MITPAQRDFYEILGVAHNADAKAIKEAFRALALKFHPDRNKSVDAQERFKEIAAAYAVLSDPKKRAEYDARGFAGVADFTPEDLFSGVDFGDIFGDADFDFGGGFAGGGLFDRLFGRRYAGPPRGRDMHVTLSVPLERIARGGEETVRYTRPVSCTQCHGSGAESGTAPHPCTACGGTGRKVVARDEQRGDAAIRVQQIMVCPQCHGRGELIDKPCQACQGAGRVDKDERLNVNIPPGADEGMALRVPGHGLPSTDDKGVPGDLYVIVTSSPDGRFTRRGADLWRIEALGVADAVLGTTRVVPTLKGTAEVNVPPGTQPGEVLRLRGQGLPVFGAHGQGDINLRIEVKIPEQLTASERALYEKLRALSNATRRSR